MLVSARAGAYPGSIEQDVGPERLERWFEREDDTYCVKPALREMITFAPQNLLQDPPFSRIDLISCRNLLIYLEPEVQKQLLGLFHFALREDGHLLLGPAENISSREDLFQPVSKKWRIYRRLGPTRHDVVDFPVVRAIEPEAGAEPEAEARPEPRPGELMDRALLERYAPASALIDARYRVHYLRGPTEHICGRRAVTPRTVCSPWRARVCSHLCARRYAGRSPRGARSSPMPAPGAATPCIRCGFASSRSNGSVMPRPGCS